MTAQRPGWQNGAALLITVLIIFAMAVFGAIALGSMAGGDITDSSYRGSSVEALFAGESGLEHAMKRFETGTACASLATTQTVAAGRTFTTLAGVTTAFDGATALQSSQCRVQSTGAVSATSASRTLQAILDRNLLVRQNATFDAPAGAGGASGWTATKWDYTGGTNTSGSPAAFTCGRAAYALHGRANGGADASATGALVDTVNGLFTVTAGDTITVRFNLRAIRITGATNAFDTAAGVADPYGNPAADVKVWFTTTDSALIVSSATTPIREAVVNPGAPLNGRAPSATPTTQGFPGDYPACNSFYATGSPSAKRQVTITVGGGAGTTRTIQRVDFFIFITKNGPSGVASEVWIDNIELFANTAQPIASKGGGRIAEWRDCAVSTCP